LRVQWQLASKRKERQRRIRWGEVGDAEAPVAQLKMKLQTGGGGVQPSCLGVRLADNVKGGAAKVLCVLFEVRAGGRCRYATGEVLDA
jgi:hypothetical protein